MDEIALLLSILEHQWRLSVHDACREYRQHAGIRIGKSLTRAIDVEEARRQGRNVVGPADNQSHSLLRVFAEGVDGVERRLLVFGRGNRRETFAVGVGKFSDAAADLLVRALLRRNQLAPISPGKA